MVHRMGVAVAAIVAVLTVGFGAGPAAAGPAETPAAVTGWVVANPSPNGIFETNEGSATVVLASGASVSCSGAEGWGRADSGTIRPQDTFGETGVTIYGGGACTGLGGLDVEIGSSPGMVFWPETYDAGADRVTGAALPWLWTGLLDVPGCQIDMWGEDENTEAPLTYDNRTGTLQIGPIPSVVSRAEGAGCAGLAQVGDRVTFATTVVATPVFTVRPA